LQYTAIKSHADEACQLLRVEGIHWQLTGRTISEIKLSALIVCQRWYFSTVLLLDGVDGVARVCIQLWQPSNRIQLFVWNAGAKKPATRRKTSSVSTGGALEVWLAARGENINEKKKLSVLIVFQVESLVEFLWLVDEGNGLGIVNYCCDLCLGFDLIILLCLSLSLLSR
jgi:hypothetical protein